MRLDFVHMPAVIPTLGTPVTSEEARIFGKMWREMFGVLYEGGNLDSLQFVAESYLENHQLDPERLQAVCVWFQYLHGFTDGCPINFE